MKMIQHNRKQRLSGFTLLEMVVVVAIIAILTTILVPTMRGYITKSRLSSANSEAKVLYNSIQTIMQEYEFRERQMEDSAFYGDTKSGEFFIKGVDGTITHAEAGTRSIGSFVYATGGGDIIGANLSTADASTFGARLSRLYSDYTTVSWAAYVVDYSVRGVFCANNATTDYVGAYPLRASERGDNFGSSEEITSRIDGCNLDSMKAYSNVAWSAAAAPAGDDTETE